MPTRRIHWLIYENKSGNLVGAIGLSSATLALGARDRWIGWDSATRLRNIVRVANNSRCCFIRARVTVKCLGSQVLKTLRRVGARRWQEKYGDPLVLLETFVDPLAYRPAEEPRNGALYRADNWIELGMTEGHSIQKLPMKLWQRENTARGKLARENPDAAREKFGPQYGASEYNCQRSDPKIIFVRPLCSVWKRYLL